MEFVKVTEEEGDELIIEVPTEDDNSLLLSTLAAQFPGAVGLKYRNSVTTIRGVRMNEEGRLFAPSQGSGWGSRVYFCVLPKECKRKSEDSLENCSSKARRKCISTTDLVVLGLPWKTTQATLRAYFEEFGEVLMAEIKTDAKTGKSKGFGFIRFSSYESQKTVLERHHFVDGRWCEVRVPNSKLEVLSIPGKIYVGRCTEDLTSKDLMRYFSKYGEIIDIYISRPFRGFSFITFRDSLVAKSLYGEDHIVKGVSLHICNATPKIESLSRQMQPIGVFANYQNSQQPRHRQPNSLFDLPNLQGLGISSGGIGIQTQNLLNVGLDFNQNTI